MSHKGSLVSGVFWLLGGILLLINWKKLVSQVIRTGNAVWGKLGVPKVSDSMEWLIGGAIVILVGVVFIFAAFADFYEVITGSEWPLRHARWEDLLPLD